ncbi:MAG TPA: DUF2325 domain-containing protein [Polyangiaceae bacterium]|nr:DUF2325 domain-containing protein [Polyangiaceae bacterium]
MHIAWIGGLDRSEGQLEALARDAGHTLEFHSGHTGGHGAAQLRTVVSRADFVLILTDVNSHGGVLLAKRLCRRANQPVLLLRRCGRARFVALLAELGNAESRQVRAAS